MGISSLSKLVKDALTGVDNQTYDMARVMGSLGVLVFLGLAIAEFVYTKKFDMQTFGIGFGLVMTGSGLAIKLKQSTEPSQ